MVEGDEGDDEVDDEEAGNNTHPCSIAPSQTHDASIHAPGAVTAFAGTWLRGRTAHCVRIVHTVCMAPDQRPTDSGTKGSVVVFTLLCASTLLHRGDFDSTISSISGSLYVGELHANVATSPPCFGPPGTVMLPHLPFCGPWLWNASPNLLHPGYCWSGDKL